MQVNLKPRRPAGRVAGSQSGAAKVGRKRTKEPDPTLPEGQCALYLRERMKQAGVDADQLAVRLEKDRSTVFKYLRGDVAISDSVRDQIAKSIGLTDYRDLMPTDEFLASIGQTVRRKRIRR